MAAVTFDTLKFSRTLEGAGFATQQAQAMAEAIADVTADLVTKKDLQIALAPVMLELADLRADNRLIKWMLGVLVAGNAAVLVRLFF